MVTVQLGLSESRQLTRKAPGVRASGSEEAEHTFTSHRLDARRRSRRVGVGPLTPRPRADSVRAGPGAPVALTGPGVSAGRGGRWHAGFGVAAAASGSPTVTVTVTVTPG